MEETAVLDCSPYMLLAKTVSANNIIVYTDSYALRNVVDGHYTTCLWPF